MSILDFLKDLFGLGNGQTAGNQRPKNPCERLIREVVRQMKEKDIDVSRDLNAQTDYVIKVDFIGQYSVELPDDTLEFRQTDDEWTRHTCMPLITEIRSQMEKYNIQVPKSIPKQMQIDIQVDLTGHITVKLPEGELTYWQALSSISKFDDDGLMIMDPGAMEWTFKKTSDS